MELASADRHRSPPAAATGHPRVEARVDRRMDAVVRAFDLLVAALLLALLAPALALIALAVRVDSKGSPIFRQHRCGRALREFTVLKFRTMQCATAVDPHRAYVLDVIRSEGGEQDGDEARLKKLENDRRVTRVGAFLRRFSLDELPQLWNVLRGEMTLVGPRPPIPYEVEWYPPHWLGRLSVKPGLTGLWQVSGRNELDYRQMVALDLEYVRRRSLWLNATILARTVSVVLTGRGAV